MTNLNSKQVGNITEIEVLLALVKLGYTVLTPYGDCDRYDLLVEINKTFYRIQCKTAALDRDPEAFSFNCRSTHKSGGKIIHQKYSKDDIDFFATSFRGKVYLIPVEQCGTRKVLRLNKPKNNHKINVYYADDYELEEVIKTL